MFCSTSAHKLFQTKLLRRLEENKHRVISKTLEPAMLASDKIVRTKLREVMKRHY